MARDCTRDDVDELLDHIESAGDWDIEDWDFSVGRHEDAELELTLQWNPPLSHETAEAVKEQIRQHGDDHGIKIKELVESLPEHDGVGSAVEQLRQAGEVYEPRAGYIQVV